VGHVVVNSCRIASSLFSTLFPYTTLFRSGLLVARHVFEQLRQCIGVVGDGQSQRREDRAVPPGGVVVEAPGQPAQFSGEHQSHRDRKSTRLNSSHDQISYAVFCLTKKTTQ